MQEILSWWEEAGGWLPFPRASAARVQHPHPRQHPRGLPPGDPQMPLSAIFDPGEAPTPDPSSFT